MTRGHWLDPLARKVLQAMGELPPEPSARPTPAAPPEPPSWVVDVNRASASQWRQLPGCSEAMVDLLLRLQRGGVQFSQAEDLIQLLDLPPELAERWRPHLVIHWYGDAPPQPPAPPLDLNAAAPERLTAALLWPADRLQRLIQERRRRPFDNLADLQERLCLPPEVVEQLIGRVRFGERRPGPSLPPGC
jgi:DNA uptake protein ComE-like DNA-binding protein